MLITTFGWRHSTLDQISRIEKGFLELNHKLISENPDFLYSNNPTFEDILSFSKRWPKAKKIFTILDCPIGLGNSYPWDLIRSQLAQADAICSISKNTQKEVKRVYGFDSEVIYQPLKPTFRIANVLRDIDILFVGRLDFNKRFNLVVETAKKLGKNLHVCGPEEPPLNDYCTYHGIVSDEDLNLLYNRSKYYLSCGKVTGIELAPIEASFCGCIPIGCADNPTNFEFLSMNADPKDLADALKEIEKDRVWISQEIMKEAPLRYKHLNYLEVAKSIINVFHKKWKFY